MSAVKKGTKSWSPSNLGDIIDKEAGYRYRRVRKDEENVSKKTEEGWEMVNSTNSPKTKAIHPSSRPDEPHQLDSTVGGRDWVLMRLDEETAKSRDDYFNDKTQRMESRITSDAKKDLGKLEASMHGSIIKERKGVKTIID